MSAKTVSRALEFPAGDVRLGVHYDGSGASFALFSSVAEAVRACPFDGSGRDDAVEPRARATVLVWQGYLPAAQPGS